MVSLLLFSLACASVGRPAFGGAAMPRALPEAEGIDARGVLALVNRLEAKIDAVHSLMLVRHGHVVAEGWWAPYAAGDMHVMYSVDKSFISTAIGLLADERRLDLDDCIAGIFPELMPPQPAAFMTQMRIRDLLTMTNGHKTDTMPHLRARAGDDWTRCFLETEVEYPPGTHFCYDSAGVYLLAAIVQRVSGEMVEEYLRPRLFEPLGIDQRLWGKSREGINEPGDLYLTTEELAKFGQLYLQGGVWAGRRLLSPQWVAGATAWQTASSSGTGGNWDAGYGFLFWRNKAGGFRADGSLGQFCFVLPEFDLVLAITSGASDTNGIMNAVWEELLPAIHAEALPANAAADEALARKLGSLALSVPDGAATSPLAAQVSGAKFTFPANNQHLASVRVEFPAGTDPVLTFADADGEHRIACGRGAWLRQRTNFKQRVNDLFDTPQQGLAAAGAWTADNVFLAKLCFHETPYTLTAKCTFRGGELQLETEYNVRWGERVQPTLVGRRATAD